MSFPGRHHSRSVIPTRQQPRRQRRVVSEECKFLGPSSHGLSNDEPCHLADSVDGGRLPADSGSHLRVPRACAPEALPERAIRWPRECQLMFEVRVCCRGWRRDVCQGGERIPAAPASSADAPRPRSGGAWRPQGWIFRGETKTARRQPAARRGGPCFGPVRWGLK